MNDSTRPPAFKVPSPKAAPLFLFFGKGDYVVARTASEASCLWMDHFDDLAYAREFVALDDLESVEIWVEITDLGRFPAEKTLDHFLPGTNDPAFIERRTAGEWVACFGLGYLASTEE
jgi:hypothetical protein